MPSLRAEESEGSDNASEPLSSKSSPDRAAGGRLIVVSGPSGVGKSTVVHVLAELRQFHFSVSATTRAPRPGEVDGVDYYFVDEPEFERMRDQGELLEWAEYSGNLYGTPRTAIEKRLAEGEDVLLDIEIKGAIQVKQAYPDAMMVFITPPSADELERRLRSRGDTSDEAIESRLRIAGWQLEVAEEQFDHVVVNDSVASAVDRIVRILEAPSTKAVP